MILLLLACSEPDTLTPPDVIRYQTTLSELEETIINSLDNGLPSILHISQGYESMIVDMADGNCPEFTQGEDGINGFWVDDCMTDDGHRFHGFSTYSQIQESQGQDQFEEQGVFGGIWGSFDALDSNGDVYSVGGIAQTGIMPNGGFDMNLNGSFWLSGYYWWMREGSSSFQIHGNVNETLDVSGGVNYPNITMYFESMVFDPHLCGGVLNGKLKLRDATGYWFEIIREECELCSVVMWQDYQVGQLCIGSALDDSMNQILDSIEPWY